MDTGFLNNCLKMHTVCFPETVVSTYKSTRPYNPEDQHRHLYSRENLKSHIENNFLSEISGSHGGEYEGCYLLGVAPCSLVEVYRRFRGAWYLHHQGDVGRLLPDYTAPHPRREPIATNSLSPSCAMALILQWIKRS
jgi:hypothetical protein